VMAKRHSCRADVFGASPLFGAGADVYKE
jgi:hypothetical protein